VTPVVMKQRTQRERISICQSIRINNFDSFR